MSQRRGSINHDLLESLERQLALGGDQMTGDDPLAELARLIDGDPLTDLDASRRGGDTAAPPATEDVASALRETSTIPETAFPETAVAIAPERHIPAPDAVEAAPEPTWSEPVTTPDTGWQAPAGGPGAVSPLNAKDAEAPVADPARYVPVSSGYEPAVDWPSEPVFGAEEQEARVASTAHAASAQDLETADFDQLALDIEAEFERQFQSAPATDATGQGSDSVTPGDTPDGRTDMAAHPVDMADQSFTPSADADWRVSGAAPDLTWDDEPASHAGSLQFGDDWPSKPSHMPETATPEQVSQLDWEVAASNGATPDTTWSADGVTPTRGAVWNDPVFDDRETDPRFSDAERPFPAGGENGSSDALYADGTGRQSRFGGPRAMMVAATVVGVVLIGAAGAFAFRGLTGGDGGTPPTIAAADDAVKVEPEQTNADEDSGKLVYDRVGDDADAQLVDRSEDPAAEGAGRMIRVIEPSANQNAEDSDSPRRVRTVVVRPDGTLVEEDDTDSAVVTANIPEPPVLADAEDALDTVTSAVEAGTETVETAADQVADQVANTVDAATDAASDAATALTEQAETTPQATTETPTQVETVSVGPLDLQQTTQTETPTQTQATTQPAQTTSANLPAGSFLVQVAAAREESQAESTASSVANRYSGIIGGYSTNIQRADLGDRGIFYRVGVGPIASQSEANGLCDRLKSAGLDCFVRQI